MSVPLFCGYDPRESVGYHTFAHSVLRSASVDVSFQALGRCGLRAGSNDFTLSRFLIPWLLGHGPSVAVFADASDMLMLGDIADLMELADNRYAVQVVKHPNYQTNHRRKYVGTEMECENRDYERKNWASLMLIHTAHPAWRIVNHKYLQEASVLNTLQLKFLPDEAIGELPPAWNVLADEGHPVDGAQILHWTAGVPAFPMYRSAPGAEHWRTALAEMVRPL